MKPHANERGVSLLEVIVAMMISGVTLLGTMGALELASRHVYQGQVSTRALAMAQARLEAKRSVSWEALLADDLNHDGVAEVMMQDDGQRFDRRADDGIYTAAQEQNGVTVVWTVESDGPGPVLSATLVTIRATAFYEGVGGTKELHLATLRANPAFVGTR
jgi:prepilin-type N-terminal cleavage/methylation domain-containing protein